MIEKAFELITCEDIANLVERKAAEGKTLEYKSELPGRTDGDCKEFLADVSAFANSAGGDILFGVEEHEGAAAGVPGVELDDVDSQIRWIEDVIRSGVEPRIPGVQVKAVTGFPKGPVIAIRVPRSWTGPHMISYKAWSRFYIRTSAGKHMMDVSEIRSAFLLAGDFPERIRGFRDHRLGKIIADECPVKLVGKACVALHLLPLVAFSGAELLFAQELSAERAHFHPLRQGIGSARFNLDGFLTTAELSPGDQGSHAYCQVFRSGTIESVNAEMFRSFGGRTQVPSLAVEEAVIDAVRGYTHALDRLGVVRPWVVSLSLLGIRGFSLAVGVPKYLPDVPILLVDRDVVVLPDVLVDEEVASFERLLRPVFDGLWNAGGYERCFDYTEQGEWKPSR